MDTNHTITILRARDNQTFFLLQGDSPELDLIALGGTETPEDIIFDPLLEKAPPDPPTSLHRPLQRTSLTTQIPPKPSNSSEDLLLEYGLDFTQLSIPKPPTLVPPINNNFDPFAPMAPTGPPVPPVAPPRTKRNVSAASANWTTFD